MLAAEFFECYRSGWNTIGRFASFPVADNEVGYQGPTDLLIAIDDANLVTGIAIGVSFDNNRMWVMCEMIRTSAVCSMAVIQDTRRDDAAKVEGVSGANDD